MASFPKKIIPLEGVKERYVTILFLWAGPRWSDRYQAPAEAWTRGVRARGQERSQVGSISLLHSAENRWYIGQSRKKEEDGNEVPRQSEACVPRTGTSIGPEASVAAVDQTEKGLLGFGWCRRKRFHRYQCGA